MRKLLPYFFFLLLSNTGLIAQSWSGYVAGSLSYSTANMNVTVSSSNFVNGTPKYDNSSNPHSAYGANCAAAPAGLYVAMDWPNTSGNTTITINFPTPVCGPLNFTLYDINQDYWNDGTTNWFYFTDKVDISALDGAATAVPAASIVVGNSCGNTVTTAGNTRTITGNFNNCLCNSNTVSIGAAGTQISQITFRYYSGPATYSTPTGNPYTQYFVISNFTTSAPAAPTAAPATICPNSSTTLSATAPSGVTFNWFTVASGGSSIFTGPSYTTPVLAANTTYYVQSTSVCGTSTRTAVPVTVSAPAAPTAAAVASTVCAGNTATLNATAPSGVTFNWYTVASGGSSVATGNSYTTAAIGANTTYYVESNGGSCVSTRTPVPVSVTSPSGGALVPGNESACDPSNILFSAAPSSVGATSYTYSWYYMNGIQSCPNGSSAAGWTLINSTTPTISSLFTDNFNTIGNPPPGGWTSTLFTDADNDMNIQVVTNPTAPAVTGTCVRFNSSAGDDNDKWDLRRTVSTTGYTSISMTFNWYETNGALHSNDNVEVFYNSGSGWTSTGQIFNRKTAVNGWQSKTVNFGTYADNNAAFQIGFRFTNGSGLTGQNCYIDDVVLNGMPIPSYNPPGPLASNRTYAALVTANGGTCAGANVWSGQCRQVTMGCLLPIELLYFNAEKLETRQSLLTWATAQEEDNRYFVVERSKDGINFEEIGRNEAKQGAVQEMRQYQWIDEHPMVGGNYYRLRQVDWSGQFSYSEIRYLEFEALASDILVYPNPSHDGIFTIETTQSATLSLLNVLGQQLGSRNLLAGQNSLHLDNAGIFLLRLQFEDNSVKIIRVVVEK